MAVFSIIYRRKIKRLPLQILKLKIKQDLYIPSAILRVFEFSYSIIEFCVASFVADGDRNVILIELFVVSLPFSNLTSFSIV